MLAENIARPAPSKFTIQLARVNGIQCRLALDHFKAVGWHKQCFGGSVVAVIGATDPLHQSLDVLGRTDLDHQIDIAPVNSQIQAAGADDGAQVSAHHSGFDLFALPAIERAMVDAYGQTFVIRKPEVVKEKLGLRAGVVENKCCFMCFYLFKHRRDGIGRIASCPWRWVFRYKYGNVWRRAGVGEQDVAGVRMARELLCNGLRVIHRGRQADAFEIRAKPLEPTKCQHQLVTSF